MKTTLTTLAILAVVAFGNTSYAQDSPEERVKILPSSLPGVIKVHYAMALNDPLQITFYSPRGEVLGKDRIHGIAAPFGVSKRYDVKKISHDDFWIEVSTRKHVFLYHIIPGNDRKRFTAVLEPVPHQLLVKANN